MVKLLLATEKVDVDSKDMGRSNAAIVGYLRKDTRPWLSCC